MSDAPLPRTPRRVLLGRALLVAGGASLLWAVLFLTTRAFGPGPPERLDFAHRRPYDQVKRDVHAAVPGMAWRGLLGLLLLSAGTRLVRRDDESADER